MKLKSGRTFEVFNDTACPGKDGELFYGYDGIVDSYHFSPEGKMTRTERQEIAEHFIERWKAWALEGSK